VYKPGLSSSPWLSGLQSPPASHHASPDDDRLLIGVRWLEADGGSALGRDACAHHIHHAAARVVGWRERHTAHVNHFGPPATTTGCSLALRGLKQREAVHLGVPRVPTTTTTPPYL